MGSRLRLEVFWVRYWFTELVRDRIPRSIAQRLPRRVVYFAVVRAWVFSQSGAYATEHPTDVRTFETAKRWDEVDH